MAKSTHVKGTTTAIEALLIPSEITASHATQFIKLRGLLSKVQSIPWTSTSTENGTGKKNVAGKKNIADKANSVIGTRANLLSDTKNNSLFQESRQHKVSEIAEDRVKHTLTTMYKNMNPYRTNKDTLEKNLSDINQLTKKFVRANTIVKDYDEKTQYPFIVDFRNALSDFVVIYNKSCSTVAAIKWRTAKNIITLANRFRQAKKADEDKKSPVVYIKADEFFRLLTDSGENDADKNEKKCKITCRLFIDAVLSWIKTVKGFVFMLHADTYERKDPETKKKVTHKVVDKDSYQTKKEASKIMLDTDLELTLGDVEDLFRSYLCESKHGDTPDNKEVNVTRAAKLYEELSARRPAKRLTSTISTLIEFLLKFINIQDKLTVFSGEAIKAIISRAGEIVEEVAQVCFAFQACTSPPKKLNTLLKKSKYLNEFDAQREADNAEHADITKTALEAKEDPVYPKELLKRLAANKSHKQPSLGIPTKVIRIQDPNNKSKFKKIGNEYDKDIIIMFKRYMERRMFSGISSNDADKRIKNQKVDKINGRSIYLHRVTKDSDELESFMTVATPLESKWYSLFELTAEVTFESSVWAKFAEQHIRQSLYKYRISTQADKIYANSIGLLMFNIIKQFCNTIRELERHDILKAKNIKKETVLALF